MNKTKFGFTLIELLIVIAVIAAIVALAFPNFNAVRQRGRDDQRKSDLKQIQKALELYKMDQSSAAYPSTNPSNSLGTCEAVWSGSGNTYMKKIPCDPGSGSVPTPYYYQRAADTLEYTLRTCLENPADSEKDDTNSCGGNTYSYTLTAP